MKNIIFLFLSQFCLACETSQSWQEDLFDIIGTDQPSCLEVNYPNSTVNRNYDHQGNEFSSTIYVYNENIAYYIMCVYGEDFSRRIAKEDKNNMTCHTETKYSGETEQVCFGKTSESCYDGTSWGNCE